MVLKYLAVKDEASPVPSIVEEEILDFCFCNFECDYQEPVFATLPADASDTIKNDQTATLYRLFDPADTITINLIRNGLDIAVLTGSALGTDFPLGSLVPQPLYRGFLIDWNKVLDAHGSGIYQVRADVVILGTPLQIFTNEFNLTLFSEYTADRTVRIETFQNGNIESSQFDYTDLNWFQSIRIPGKFWDKQPKFTTENLLSGSRSIIQVQDSVRNVYTLNTELLNSKAANRMIYDYFLANKVFITDYNLFNFEIYRQLEVYPEDYGDATYFSQSRKGIFEFTFTDKKQDILKRNF